jgi:hypothetical protein
LCSRRGCISSERLRLANSIPDTELLPGTPGAWHPRTIEASLPAEGNRQGGRSPWRGGLLLIPLVRIHFVHWLKTLAN